MFVYKQPQLTNWKRRLEYEGYERKRLTTEWRTWIRDNIQKGTPWQSIVASMLQKGFDPSYAMTAVQILNDEMKSDYIYETPRFCHDGGYIQTSDRRIVIRSRLDKPCIAILDDVLSHEECQQLIALSSQTRMQRSAVGEGTIMDSRTSHGNSFKRKENDFISGLELRFSEIMNWPSDHGENLQILNYKPGEEYKQHFDYFPQGSSFLEKRGQRVSTLVVYLNDVEEGGATTFPTVGLSVLPKRGSAVYFEYCNSLGQVDPLTLHAGAPVIKGEKWIATQWMCQRKKEVKQ